MKNLRKSVINLHDTRGRTGRQIFGLVSTEEHCQNLQIIIKTNETQFSRHGIQYYKRFMYCTASLHSLHDFQKFLLNFMSNENRKSKIGMSLHSVRF